MSGYPQKTDVMPRSFPCTGNRPASSIAPDRKPSGWLIGKTPGAWIRVQAFGVFLFDLRWLVHGPSSPPHHPSAPAAGSPSRPPAPASRSSGRRYRRPPRSCRPSEPPPNWLRRRARGLGRKRCGRCRCRRSIEQCPPPRRYSLHRGAEPALALTSVEPGLLIRQMPTLGKFKPGWALQPL